MSGTPVVPLAMDLHGPGGADQQQQQQQPPQQQQPMHALQPAVAAPGVQSINQSAEWFLSNYNFGKTLGIGSFGKVSEGGFCLWANVTPRTGTKPELG